jgi:hypothetical protein
VEAARVRWTLLRTNSQNSTDSGADAIGTDYQIVLHYFAISKGDFVGFEIDVVTLYDISIDVFPMSDLNQSHLVVHQ